ncbi:hypothetical protein [Parasphingorhabdus sp.]
MRPDSTLLWPWAANDRQLVDERAEVAIKLCCATVPLMRPFGRP